MAGRRADKGNRGAKGDRDGIWRNGIITKQVALWVFAWARGRSVRVRLSVLE